MIESISAITLGTHDMGRAVHFYRSLGFELLYGGEAAAFTSFRAGTGYLNLTAQPDASLRPRRAMQNGVSATSISPTPTAMSSVSRGRCPDRISHIR